MEVRHRLQIEVHIALKILQNLSNPIIIMHLIQKLVINTKSRPLKDRQLQILFKILEIDNQGVKICKKLIKKI